MMTEFSMPLLNFPQAQEGRYQGTHSLWDEWRRRANRKFQLRSTETVSIPASDYNKSTNQLVTTGASLLPARPTSLGKKSYTRR